MAVEIVKATYEHALELALYMRISDVLELHRMERSDPDAGVLGALDKSTEAWTMLTDSGDVLAVCGVVENPEKCVFIPWLLGSDLIEEHARGFCVASREVVTLMRGHGDLLNVVDAMNTTSIKWLKWLGFKFPLPPEPIGIAGELGLVFGMGGLK